MAFFQFVIFCFLGLLFALPAYSKVDIDTTCVRQNRQDVEDAMSDAEQMALGELPIS